MSTQKTSPVADKLKGSINRAIGKLIGDGKVEAQGRSQQELPKSDATPKTRTRL